MLKDLVHSVYVDNLDDALWCLLQMMREQAGSEAVDIWKGGWSRNVNRRLERSMMVL